MGYGSWKDYVESQGAETPEEEAALVREAEAGPDLFDLLKQHREHEDEAEAERAAPSVSPAPAPWEAGAPDEYGINPWAGAEPGVCDEDGCTAPQRRLLRFRGGVYLSAWCWEHGETCVVCHGAIDDGAELCEYHAERLGHRYEGELPEDVRRALRAGTHPLQLADPAARVRR